MISWDYGLGRKTTGKMPGWMNHKVESILLGEISTTSDMQIILL